MAGSAKNGRLSGSSPWLPTFGTVNPAVAFSAVSTMIDTAARSAAADAPETVA
jgi:hypothetical protein